MSTLISKIPIKCLWIRGLLFLMSYLNYVLFPWIEYINFFCWNIVVCSNFFRFPFHHHKLKDHDNTNHSWNLQKRGSVTFFPCEILPTYKIY